MDDETLRYIIAAKPLFETLRGITIQLAGFALRNAFDAGGGHLQDAPLESAAPVLAETVDGLRGLRVTERTSHHHHHLMELAQSLRLAVESGRRSLLIRSRAASDTTRDKPLNDAVAHLRSAAAALPGFAVIDLDHACCAWHPQPYLGDIQR